MLSFYPDFSCDYNDSFNGPKLIFSIGCWGAHKEIMSIVCDALAPFGRVFYCEDDSTDEFVEIN